MKLLKEFKDFIMTGNVLELAVAVILAGAVGSVVTGFVSDIMMPLIGYFIGGNDISYLKYVLIEATYNIDGTISKPENAILYGAWINKIISLIIIGFILFIIIKTYNKTKKQKQSEPETPKIPTQEEILIEIRDLLKK